MWIYVGFVEIVNAHDSSSTTCCITGAEQELFIGAVDRVGEDEAQGRNDAVLGRHGNTVVLLRDLEPAHRRPAQKACEPTDIAQVVALSPG